MVTRRRIAGVVLAVILAFLLGVLGALVADRERDGTLFVVFFLAGLVGYSVLLLRAGRMGFWFCLIYGIEWLLLPVTTAINAQQFQGTGCAAVGAAIAVGISLALSIPVGVILGLIFLILAFWKFRKRPTR